MKLHSDIPVGLCNKYCRPIVIDENINVPQGKLFSLFYGRIFDLIHHDEYKKLRVIYLQVHVESTSLFLNYDILASYHLC